MSGELYVEQVSGATLCNPTSLFVAHLIAKLQDAHTFALKLQRKAQRHRSSSVNILTREDTRRALGRRFGVAQSSHFERCQQRDCSEAGSVKVGAISDCAENLLQWMSRLFRYRQSGWPIGICHADQLVPYHVD